MTRRATAFLGAALRLGAAFRFGAALRFAGALRFGAAFLTAFFLPLVAEMVVVGAMDVAANLRYWVACRKRTPPPVIFQSKLVQRCSARDLGRTDRDGGKRQCGRELCGGRQGS